MIPIHQIHPALVHFPIVLFTLVLVLDVMIVTRGGNLTDRTQLSTTAFWLMWAGIASAALAAVFGAIAAGYALEQGFPMDPIAAHQGAAVLAVVVFLVVAIVLSILRKRGTPLAAGRGWIYCFVMLIGVVLLVNTAYLGGHLVFGLGVNVDVVKPGG